MFTLAEIKGGFGDMQGTNWTERQFEAGDLRKDETVFYEGTSKLFWGSTWEEWVFEEDEETGELIPIVGNPDKTVGIYKYSEQVKVENNHGDEMDVVADAGTDLIIFRYADILLLYAETLNKNGKTNEAYQYINEVRRRAGLDDLTAGLSESDFHEAIIQERAVELMFESIRMFDLKRWGLWNSSLVANDPNFEGFVDGKSEVAPIPQRALDLNENLVQNPGY
jgi:hypothetical protein